jgi:hypothetical protein
MDHVRDIVRAHPHGSRLDEAGRIECIASLMACGQSCTNCADACLNEDDVMGLVPCVAADLDCADVCFATGRILSRQTTNSWALLRGQLQACVIACRVCAEECDRHADHHVHCRICAEACRDCAQKCTTMLRAMPSA